MTDEEKCFFLIVLDECPVTSYVFAGEGREGQAGHHHQILITGGHCVEREEVI